MPYMIEARFRVKSVSPAKFAGIRAKVRPTELGSTISHLLTELWDYLGSLPSVTLGPAIARYHAWAEESYEIEAGFPIQEDVPPTDRVAVSQLPGGPAATVIHHGPFELLPRVYADLEAWMRREGHVAAGLPWEVYWVDPSRVSDPSELRTEVVWPLRAQSGGETEPG